MSAARMVKEENKEQKKGRAQVEDFVLQNKIKLIILTKHYFANKGSSSQGYGFSCGHVWMQELDCEEG